MAALGPILVGSILTGRNKKVRKDGSVYVSKPYYSFQYRDAAMRCGALCGSFKEGADTLRRLASVSTCESLNCGT